jgi:hypothetical protein
MFGFLDPSLIRVGMNSLLQIRDQDTDGTIAPQALWIICHMWQAFRNEPGT